MSLAKTRCDYCKKMKEFIIRNVDSRLKLKMCLECHTKAEQTETPQYGTHQPGK